MVATVALALPASAGAAMLSFGSPLSVPATLDTANNLHYAGTSAIQNGTGVTIHNGHDGADTALWNTTLASGTPTAPAAGQVLSVSLKGCAEPAAGGPAPLTQFHLQSLTPLPGGGATVAVTSQAFDLPVCGAATAAGGVGSGATVNTYRPTNMCVSAGGYVDFNDEGGFNPQFYPSGVPYEVIGAVTGSTMSSYIDADGTNNGDALSAMNVTATNGFASNPNAEVLLRATIGTGTDSIGACVAGGSTPTKPPPVTHHPEPGQPGGPPGVVVTPRPEHVSRTGSVRVALFCSQKTVSCGGTVALTKGTVTMASARFVSKVLTTAHIRLQLSPAAAKLVRHAGAPGLPTTMTVAQPGQAPVRATITLKAA